MLQVFISKIIYFSTEKFITDINFNMNLGKQLFFDQHI